VRGTPLMLQLYAIFFLLPKLGIELSPIVAAISGLAINYSAYEAEIYRAGFQAVPLGQWEAALSLGMTRGQAIRRILLPQAFRLVIPPVTNDFIALFKDTSVCSVVTVVELTKRYSVLALSTGAIVELAAVTAVLYLLMSYPLSLVARWSERRLAGK
jgi:polar amino acid transport system substrate-binding protein